MEQNHVKTFEQFVNESKEHYLLQQILLLTKDVDKKQAVQKLEKIHDMIRFAFPSL